MSPRAVSIIINTYNRRESLALVLRALAWLDYPLFEVIVINGPSTDDTADFLEGFSGKIKIGRCDHRNLSESRNIGVKMANGEIVAFIDDDAYPDPGWLTGLVEAYESSETVAAGGPVFGHTGYELQTWYSIADRFGDAWMDFPPAPNPTPFLSAPGSRNFIYSIGTNSSFRRDRLVSLGGFDEEFEYYLEEADVCCRMLDAGFVVCALDAGFVYHKFLPSEIREGNRVVKDWYQILKSKFYFSMKHGLPFSSFAEVCAEQSKFIEKVRADVNHHFGTGTHDVATRDKFEQDVVDASNQALRLYVEGSTREHSPEWFDNSAWEFLPFETQHTSAERLHVCFLTQEYPPAPVNGIGRVIHSLAGGLAALGHVVRVLTRGEGHNQVDFEDGVWVHRIVPVEQPLPSELDVPAQIWNYSATLLQELRRIEGVRPVDIVQSPIGIPRALPRSLTVDSR